MSTTTRGVRKVSENILSDGRAIIVTEKDKDKYKWSDIPVGSKFIDSKTGIEMVKLEGESTWVPADIKNDGTLCIAKDSRTIIEVFTIVSLNDGDGTFTYKNSKDENRHMPLIENQYDKDHPYHVFEIENGSYQPLRNGLEIVINDVLHRNAKSGGVLELSDTRFALIEQLSVGQEITVRYLDTLRIGNPYPRVFIKKDAPSKAEDGDLWVDEDGDLEGETYLGDHSGEPSKTVPWNMVAGKPTTLTGFNLQDEVQQMIDQHRVEISMIDNLPKHDNINAVLLNGHTTGQNPNQVFLIPSDGKIPMEMFPTSILSAINNMTFNFYIGSTAPSNPVNNETVWFCTKSDSTGVKVYTGNAWVNMGSVWQ